MKRQGQIDQDPVYSFLTDSVQMYSMGIPFYAVGIVFSSTREPATLPATEAAGVVLNAACCGIFVGTIFKFYSSVIRCYVQGVTMILTVLVAWLVLSEPLTPAFAVSTILVMSAVILFNHPASTSAQKTTHQEMLGSKSEPPG